MSKRPDPPRTVGELGEFPLIRRLLERTGSPRSDVVVGPGDDVAVIDTGSDRLLLATCDAQVAGTHFLEAGVDPLRLGRKAAAINLSDIASAGGRPTHFLVSLTLPAETETAFVEAIYDGLAEEASRYGADVVGGNVSRGDTLVLDLTLLGEVAPAELTRRDGARVGDRVMVTGAFGAAAAGLHVARNPDLDLADDVRSAAVDAFQTPTPRVPEGRALASSGKVTSMIDVSDGLAADLTHVVEASGVGVKIDAAAIPIARAAREVASTGGFDPVAWALGGGEDYELLFTAAADGALELAARVAGQTGTPVTIVGEIVSVDRGRSVRMPGGAQTALSAAGWRHF